MADVRCFWMTPTNRVQLYLRRFVSRNHVCPGPMTYHDARASLMEVEKGDSAQAISTIPYDDPRWPKSCMCGYLFKPGDQRQLFASDVYEREDTKERYPLEEAPPGAMWDGSWLGERFRGPDGIHLMVRLPNGADWMVDAPSANMNRPWQRFGAPPNVTASPSILLGGYHGWLRNGVLTSV